MSAAYEEKRKAGEVGFEEELKWHVMLDEYMRDFNKRILDKAVDKEE